jgi:mannose-6-phosphate isomerase-like protein (cupin superfamily)
MLTLTALAFVLSLDSQPAAQAPAPVPAIFISKEEHEQVLADQIAKKVVDQPIKSGQVLGGMTSVATLHRVKPEVTSLIHDTVTETYYILSGSGTLVTGGSLVGAKPIDLTRLNVGMGQNGTRQGGVSQRVKPGDVIVIPAGTPHGFSELDGPISYLVFRFGPAVK